MTKRLIVPGSFAFLLRGFTFWGCSALLGCSTGGTETGNPRTMTSSLGFAVHSSSPDVALGPGLGGDRVEGAWLRFDRIATSSCPATSIAATGSSLISGAFVVDLLDANAQFPDLTLATDPLCGIELTLASGATNAAGPPPGPLGAASILVTGTRQDGAPFAISTSTTLRFTLLAPAPIDPAEYESVLLGFDVAVWLTGTDLAAVPLDAQGVARLDGALQPGSTTTFETQVPAGTRLYPDLNGNGALDANELTQPIAQR